MVSYHEMSHSMTVVRVKVIPGTERPACAERVYQGRKYMLHGLLKVSFGHLLLYVLEG